MTRTVLTGPPRRALAWVAAALAGVLAAAAVSPAPDVAARDEPAKAALPADLALVPKEALGFLTVRLADLCKDEGTKGVREKLAKEAPEHLKQTEKALGVPPADVERLTFLVPLAPEREDRGLPVIVIVVRTLKPYDLDKVLAATLPAARAVKHNAKTYHVAGPAAVFAADKNTYVMGRAEGVEVLMDQEGKNAGGDLGPALKAAAGKYHVAAGLRPSALLKLFGEKLPQEIEPYKPLLQVRAASATVDFGKDAQVQGRLTTPDEGAARDAADAARKLVELVREQLPEFEKVLDRNKTKPAALKKVVKRFGDDLKLASIDTIGETVSLSLTVKSDLPALSQALAELDDVAREEANALAGLNNLQQLALAIIDKADAENGVMPTYAICDKADKPLLSWRVAILPYIDQDDLYKQFHLDEPWDSDHNKKLLAKMPKVFARPGAGPKETRTHYRVFHGPGAAFEGNKLLRYPASFADGTSNTILIVEAEEAVAWTKPEELEYDPKKDLPKLGLKDNDYFLAALAEGSVRRVSKKISKETLHAAITRAAGDLLGPDW